MLGELPRGHALDDAKITRTDFSRHGANFQLELLFCGMHLTVASERLLGGHVLQGVSFCNFGMRRDFCMRMSVSKRMIPVRRKVPEHTKIQPSTPAHRRCAFKVYTMS